MLHFLVLDRFIRALNNKEIEPADIQALEVILSDMVEICQYNETGNTEPDIDDLLGINRED
jgi:hypothetical protein